MIILSYLFLSLSFNKTDKFSASISKYLIINGTCVMMVCKVITLMLLEICCVVDILNICIVSFLITSLICCYSFFVERKYQNNHNSTLILFKFMLNLIFCWGCVLLFIGNFIKNYSFNGLLPMFLVSSVLYILMILYFENNTFDISMSEPIKDIEVYNNLRLFIKAIESKNKDRESIMNIISYSYYYSKINKVKQIKNIDNLAKIIEQTKEIGENNSEIDFILYQHIDNLYKNALNTFKNSPILLVNYGVFQMEKLYKYQKSYRTIQKASEIENLSFSESFFIYRIKRNLEERGIEMGIEQTHISFAFQTKQILSLIQKISSHYSQFWNLLLTKNESMDINQLKNLGIKIDEMRKTIKEKYNSLVLNGLSTKKINLLYSNFVSEILNESEDNKIINNNYIDDNEKFKEAFLDLNYLESKPDYQFIIINGFGDSFGIIKKISLEVCELLGYSDGDLIGKNMNIILPDFMREKHEIMLRDKIKNITNLNNNLNNLKEYFVLFRNYAKFLVPVFTDIGIIHDENNHTMFFLKLSDGVDKNNESLRNKCFIIINNKLNIQNFTPNCLNLLDFESNFLNGNYEIVQFINEFNQEITNQSEQETNNLELKINILNKFFINDSGKIITWKNNKKFQCSTFPIIILNEIIGYRFELEYIENFLEFRKSTSNRKSTFQNINENFKISPDFIPSTDEEINFNVEEKIFFLKNKFDLKEDEEYMSIQKFFEKKYKDDIKLEKDIINEESFNASSSEESNEEYDEYEEEEDEENSLSDNIIKDKNMINQKSIFKQDNTNYQDYYKVNISKIKFKIYDFNIHSFTEVNNIHFENRVEEIMNGEKNKTKTLSLNKSEIKNGKEIINKYNLETNKRVKNELIPSEYFGKNIVVKNLIYPHLINDSIKILLLFNLISLIILLIIPYITFSQIRESIKKIYKLSSYVHIQCSITEDILLTCYYLTRFILIKNPNFKNSYIKDRKEYSQYLYNLIAELYLKAEEDLDYFIYEKPKISKKSEQIIKNYVFKLNLHWYTGNYSYLFDEKYITMIPAIQIFFYHSLYFINLEESFQNFLHPSSQYITSNYHIIADEMSVLNQYYLDEINEISKDKKVYLWIIFILYLLFEIIIICICVLGMIKTIREKEKYLNYFYKIDIDTVKMMNSRCQKYVKIQLDKNTLNQKQDFLNSDSSEDDEETLLSIKENQSSHSSSFKNNKISKFKQENIFKNKSFQKDILITVIFNLILLMIILIFILLANNSNIKFFNSALINILSLEQERYFLKNINYMDDKLINAGYELYLKSIKIDINTMLSYFKNNFNQIRKLELEIYGNITEKGLPGNVSTIIIENLTTELCVYFQSMNLSNISCNDFAYDIVDYGLMPIYAYCLKIIIEITFDYYHKVNTSLNKGFFYLDFAYGTTLFKGINFDYLGEEYTSLNPFNIFNDKEYNNINLIVLNVLIPFYKSLMDILFVSFEKFFHDCYNLSKIFDYIFLGIVAVYFIFINFPIVYKENQDINKTRTILSVIPKNVIYEIIKTENIKEE